MPLFVRSRKSSIKTWCVCRLELAGELLLWGSMQACLCVESQSISMSALAGYGASFKSWRNGGCLRPTSLQGCPNLNPIEHAWDQLERAVYARHPRNLQDLRHRLMEEWDALPQYWIGRSIRSMRRRCECDFCLGRHDTLLTFFCTFFLCKSISFNLYV